MRLTQEIEREKEKMYTLEFGGSRKKETLKKNGILIMRKMIKKDAFKKKWLISSKQQETRAGTQFQFLMSWPVPFYKQTLPT